MWTSIRSNSIIQPRHCGQKPCSMAPQPAPRRATRSRTQFVSNTANSMFPELSDGRCATINFQVCRDSPASATSAPCKQVCSSQSSSLTTALPHAGLELVQRHGGAPAVAVPDCPGVPARPQRPTGIHHDYWSVITRTRHMHQHAWKWPARPAPCWQVGSRCIQLQCVQVSSCVPPAQGCEPAGAMMVP
jgi:hypothetical protein